MDREKLLNVNHLNACETKITEYGLTAGIIRIQKKPKLIYKETITYKKNKVYLLYSSNNGKGSAKIINSFWTPHFKRCGGEEISLLSWHMEQTGCYTIEKKACEREEQVTTQKYEWLGKRLICYPYLLNVQEIMFKIICSWEELKKTKPQTPAQWFFFFFLW